MSKIEWTGKTWNPVIGCTPVSPGCLNCYAARMALRMQANPGTPEYHPRKVAVPVEACQECDRSGRDADAGECGVCSGDRPIGRTVRIAEVKGGRPVFTGEVRCLPERLTEPMKWRRPTMVFVDSMSDLFHEAVPFEFIDRVFAVMALCPQHTFQVLTKRPERMAEYLLTRRHVGEKLYDPETHIGLAAMGMVFDAKDADPASTLGKGVMLHRDGEPVKWPLPNVWLGTSVENPKATERVQHLLACPAAVRFLSCEPLLAALDLRRCEAEANRTIDSFTGRWSWRHRYPHTDGGIAEGKGNASIHWVIVGGESGPGARSCDVEWIRNIVGQCKGAGVPVFVKQLGAKAVFGAHADGSPCVGKWYEPTVGDDFDTRHINDRKGGDPAEWPEDLRVRQMPGEAFTTESTGGTERGRG